MASKRCGYCNGKGSTGHPGDYHTCSFCGGSGHLPVQTVRPAPKRKGRK